jgi:hypothetical protein
MDRLHGEIVHVPKQQVRCFSRGVPYLVAAFAAYHGTTESPATKEPGGATADRHKEGQQQQQGLSVTSSIDTS